MLFPTLSNAGRTAPLEEALKGAASLTDTASGLLDSPSLDRLADERNPESKVL